MLTRYVLLLLITQGLFLEQHKSHALFQFLFCESKGKQKSHRILQNFDINFRRGCYIKAKQKGSKFEMWAYAAKTGKEDIFKHNCLLLHNAVVKRLSKKPLLKSSHKFKFLCPFLLSLSTVSLRFSFSSFRNSL